MYSHVLPASDECGVSLMEEEIKMTSIQITTRTRDRLYWLKFRKTYDQFLNELMDLFEEIKGGESGFKP